MFTDKTCKEFSVSLASKNPVPGGGGASALVGSLGAALGNMVGSLTVGKKKYADVEEKMVKLMERGEKLRQELLELVEKDARVFEPLAAAYGMPTSTEEEKALKDEVMAKALVDASTIPLEIMRKCCEVIDLQKDFAEFGSKIAVSDAGVGVVFAKSALQGASLNVFINTKSMRDRALADKIEREADDMLEKYTTMADKVYESVVCQLRK